MLSWREELRAQVRLAVPVVFVQLGLYAMGAVDGAFMGRVSAVQYAAVSVGHTWTFIFLAFGIGVLSALDPIVSQAWGARDLPAIARALQRGVGTALGLSVLFGFLVWPADTVLSLFDQAPEVIPSATTYARISILALPPFLIFVAIRQTMQAMHLLRPLVVVILLTNLLNAFLDWVLIFGKLGFEPMGARGSAWATVLARWAMVLCIPYFAGSEVRHHLWPIAGRVLEPRAFGRMLRIGLPIGFQFGFEVGAFCAVTILAGRLGASALSGHQVALSLASASFMIPLGISMAAAVRVGNAIGKDDAAAVRRAALVPLAAGALIMAFFGVLFLTAPRPLARIFTNLDDVLSVAVLLIPLAGLFQVFDGTQIVATGVMRGMADTRVPMLFHVLGFWGIAIPLGWTLAFGEGRGAPGLWWGLVFGLAAVAVAQGLRVRVLLRRTFRRVVIDDPEPAGSPLEGSARDVDSASREALDPPA